MSDPLLQKAKEKAARIEKPIAVEVRGIGRMYVRPRLMGERDAADEAAIKGEFDAVCLSVARLLCDENGKRKSPEAIAEWAAVFKQLPENDIATIGNAADGNTDEKRADKPGN